MRSTQRTVAAGSAAVMASAMLILLPGTASATSPDIVLSQVHGGGGNAGAPYANDFVELYNRGASSVPVRTTAW